MKQLHWFKFGIMPNCAAPVHGQWSQLSTAFFSPTLHHCPKAVNYFTRLSQRFSSFYFKDYSMPYFSYIPIKL